MLWLFYQFYSNFVFVLKNVVADDRLIMIIIQNSFNTIIFYFFHLWKKIKITKSTEFSRRFLSMLLNQFSWRFETNGMVSMGFWKRVVKIEFSTFLMTEFEVYLLFRMVNQEWVEGHVYCIGSQAQNASHIHLFDWFQLI